MSKFETNPLNNKDIGVSIIFRTFTGHFQDISVTQLIVASPFPAETSAIEGVKRKLPLQFRIVFFLACEADKFMILGKTTLVSRH